MIQHFFLRRDGLKEDEAPSAQLSIIKGLLRSFNWREQILPPAKLQPSKVKIRKTYLEKEGFLFDVLYVQEVLTHFYIVTYYIKRAIYLSKSIIIYWILWTIIGSVSWSYWTLYINWTQYNGHPVRCRFFRLRHTISNKKSKSMFEMVEEQGTLKTKYLI